MFHFSNRNKALAAAVGAALAAGSLPAMADVKLYGRVHVSVDWVDPGSKGATTDAGSRKNMYVSSNSSRWGLDASEKLGGDVTAIARLETEIDATGETASQNTRNRYVGVSSRWGQLIAGVYDTPFKQIRSAVDLFDEQPGDIRNVVNGGAGWDLRPPNALRYDTPKLNGFVANYLHSTDRTADTTGEDNRRRLDSVGVNYAQGPLYAAFAYETHRYNTVADGGNPTETGYRLGASYTVGAFKVIGLYNDVKDLGGTAPGASSVKRKSWALGGAYTLGNNLFKLQYTKADDLSNNTAGASQPETGARIWAIGWEHMFSKTTKTYIDYAKTDNDTNSSFAVSNSGRGDTVTPGAGGDPQAWSIGMVFNF